MGEEEDKHQVDEEESVGPANEDDFIYLDEEQLEAMDRENFGIDEEGGEDDDFQTINESEIGEG